MHAVKCTHFIIGMRSSTAALSITHDLPMDLQSNGVVINY